MYALQSAVLDTVVLKGTKNYTLDRREKRTTNAADGTLHTTFAAVQRDAPMVTFTTVGCKTLLNSLSTSLDVPMKNIATALDLHFALQSSTAPGYAGTNQGIRISKGHVYLAGLKWSPGSDGLEGTVNAYALSADGTTDAITAITPTLNTPQSDEVFTLTSLTVGGVSVPKCSSFDLAIAHQGENNDEALCYDFGLPRPKLMKVAGPGGPVSISVAIETLDQSLSIPTTGTVVAVFTALAFGGTLGASTITLTINSSMIREDQKTAQQGSPSSRRFAVQARHDGTNRPLTWATT